MNFFVLCNFGIARNRRQLERTHHDGGREDLIRQDGDGFKLVKRKINIDARVIDDKNLYFFA